MGMKNTERSLELTDDLITDIISRVSDKDLMRFTCVSKSWCSLINTDDSYLYQLRSQRTVLLHRPFLIIRKSQYTPISGPWSYYNYWLELESIEDGNPKPRQLHNPFHHDDDDSPRQDARVVASCEGLLVLQQLSSQKMVVLNPTTKKHHVVPPNPAGDDNVSFMGLGYDRVHDCYKLVTKIEHPSSDRVVELVIYNVNNGTWKKSRFDGADKWRNARFYADRDDDDYYYECCFYEVGVCVDNALYWPVHIIAEMRKILCFVLAKEEFHDVGLPDFDEAMDSAGPATVFDGRLGLVGQDSPNRKTELWLMECDDKRSCRWIKFLSISDPELPSQDFNYSDLILM